MEIEELAQALTRTGRRVKRRLTAERKRIFIETLARCGIFVESARVASPHSKDRHGASATFRDEMKRDPEFAAQVQAAQEQADAALLMEARRRAVDGVPRGIFQRGGRVKDHDGKPATEQVYSDRLMELLLKSRFPDDFVERRQIEHRQASGWVITSADLHCLNDEETEWLHRIMGRVMEHRGEIESGTELEYAKVEAIEAEFETVSDEDRVDHIPW